MQIESGLRNLRKASTATSVFAILLILAGLAEIGLGGMAVKQEHERIAAVEEEMRKASAFYGYRDRYRTRNDPYASYNKSSSAFVSQGRFIPASDSIAKSEPTAIAFMVLALSALAFLASALFWVWRAHANLREVGIRAKYGPGKALAAYLIPVVNLILPFEAMRELYNRSHGEPEDFAHSTVEDVTAWWTAVVVGLLIFSAMVVKFLFDLGTNLVIMTPLWMEYAIASFAICLLLGSAYLFAGLTRRITQAQSEYLPSVDPGELLQEEPQRPSVSLR